ncbi:hypothetical protein ANRL1_01188 [Anaerolineae bacterium]|nr:hypothetical protein ANRL1_01188 [Anaerolineae bacterium]
MEFSPEQQAFIDGLVNKKYTEAYAKAKEKYDASLVEAVANAEAKHKTDMAALKAENETLKAGQGKVDDKAVTERIAAIEGQLKQAREAAAKGRLESIAAKMNAVNPEQVAVLIRQHIKTDDNGNLVIVNAEGQPRLNAASKPMTEDELFKEFLDNNQHLVKASGSTGAGSSGAQLGNGAANNDALLKLPPVERINAARAAGAK